MILKVWSYFNLPFWSGMGLVLVWVNLILLWGYLLWYLHLLFSNLALSNGHVDIHYMNWKICNLKLCHNFFFYNFHFLLLKHILHVIVFRWIYDLMLNITTDMIGLPHRSLYFDPLSGTSKTIGKKSSFLLILWFSTLWFVLWQFVQYIHVFFLIVWHFELILFY